jgi:hypothetical protein
VYGCRCGAAITQLSDAEQRGRARLVEDGQATAQQVGCHGFAQIVKELTYTSYTNLWNLPIAHATLFGVVKAYWNLVLQARKKGEARQWYMMEAWAKKLLVARRKNVTSSVDFGRPYRCIILQRGHYVMEDYLHFTQCFSVLLLQPCPVKGALLSPKLTAMWANLR